MVEWREGVSWIKQHLPKDAVENVVSGLKGNIGEYSTLYDSGSSNYVPVETFHWLLELATTEAKPLLEDALAKRKRFFVECRCGLLALGVKAGHKEFSRELTATVRTVAIKERSS